MLWEVVPDMQVPPDVGKITIPRISRVLIARRKPAWSLRIPRVVSEHSTAVVFVAVAICARLVFWMYTDRIWEDAVIALASARNLWDGFGLTHHAGEPPVQSFTSPLGEFILIVGEGFRHGLLVMRLASVLASAATVYYAYRIGLLFRFHWSAQVLVLGYLATDQLQVFFGMAGMETQVATAILMANAYYYASSQWWKLGVTAGLAALCRPEFVIWGAILGVTVLAFHRDALCKIACFAAAVAAPWFVFATIYYGTPVPHTVIAKAAANGGSLPREWSAISSYLATSWQHIAPFRQYWATTTTPLPDWLLKTIVATVVGLALIGAVRCVLERTRLGAIAALLGAIIVYRSAYVVNPYFMWHLLPFTALLFVLAGYGLSRLTSWGQVPVSAVSFFLFFAYLVHMPFSMPLDRKVQAEIEVAVRQRTGAVLSGLMGPNDSVVLEPAGFIGWAVRDKTIYDYPGLSSPAALQAFRETGGSMAGLIESLRPTYLVMRPEELEEWRLLRPKVAAQYELVRSVDADDVTLNRWGYEYSVMDDHFEILHLDSRAENWRLAAQQAVAPILQANALRPPYVRKILEGIFAHAPSQLRLPVKEATRLRIGFGMLDGSWNGNEGTSGVCFRLTVPSGGSVIWERCLNPRDDPRDRGSQSAEVDIPKGVSELRLDTVCKASCNWGWSYWSKAEIAIP